MARADGTTGSEGFVFTNSYQTSTSYELQGGLEIVKTLNGHDLHAGMFSFTVTGEVMLQSKSSTSCCARMRASSP